MWAAEAHSKLEVLQFLAAKGADINAKSKDGYTALIYAGKLAKMDAMEFLVSKGADVNAQAADGATALSFCINIGPASLRERLYTGIKCSQLLLKAGANANIENHAGRTPLYTVTHQFSQAVNPELQSCDLRLMEVLLEAKANPNLAVNGVSPLYLLLENRQTPAYKDAVALLIKSNADVNAKNQRGQTALDLVTEPLQWAQKRVKSATVSGNAEELAAANAILGPQRETYALLRAHGALSADELPGVAAHEIGLFGTAGEIDAPNQTLVLTAIAWMAPGGQTSALSAPKAKTVILDGHSFVRVPGIERRKPTMADIPAGAMLWVIGQDKGSGQRLPARVVIVLPAP